jgi:hypothetical protein
MARYQIPKNAGQFTVVAAGRGVAVWNHKTGPGRVWIPCRDSQQAYDLCARLNSKKHDGEIWM